MKIFSMNMDSLLIRCDLIREELNDGITKTNKFGIHFLVFHLLSSSYWHQMAHHLVVSITQ